MLTIRQGLAHRSLAVAVVWAVVWGALGCGAEPAPRKRRPQVVEEEPPRDEDDYGSEEDEAIDESYTGNTLPTSRGTLPAAKIDAVIAKRFGDLETCYTKLLKRKPGASGTVNFHFTIAESGRAKNLRVRSKQFDDRKFLRCTAHAMMNLEFPRPKGGEVSVIYPVNLAR